MSTLRGVDALNDVSSGHLWTPILIGVVESIDKLSTDRKIAQYMLKNRLLMSYMEKDDIRNRFARMLAALSM